MHGLVPKFSESNERLRVQQNILLHPGVDFAYMYICKFCKSCEKSVHVNGAYGISLTSPHGVKYFNLGHN